MALTPHLRAVEKVDGSEAGERLPRRERGYCQVDRKLVLHRRNLVAASIYAPATELAQPLIRQRLIQCSSNEMSSRRVDPGRCSSPWNACGLDFLEPQRTDRGLTKVGMGDKAQGLCTCRPYFRCRPCRTLNSYLTPLQMRLVRSGPSCNTYSKNPCDFERVQMVPSSKN